MAWLHTWGGLVFSWLLFAIFFTGTLAFYREELTVWMQPEIHRARQATDYGIAAALLELQQRAPNAQTWSMNLPGPRRQVLEARWSNGTFDPKAVIVIDPKTGQQLHPRETVGGNFFRNFHFSLMAATAGQWIVGVATLMMLVGLITGVVVHKKIFRDFFTFRPQKSPPRAWLDAHNLAGVLALPFHLTITYTGLLTLMYVFMPAGMNLDGQGFQGFLNQISPRIDTPAAQGRAAPLTSLDTLVARASDHWEGAAIGSIQISQPGDAAAVVDIVRRRSAGFTARMDPRLRFNGITGEQLAEYRQKGPAVSTYGALYGLHAAWFADQPLRALLFTMGLMGSLMVASGSLMWSAKRREQHGADDSSVGYRVVEALNAAGIAGLMLSSAALFWINRLLPVDLAARMGWEMRCFFGVWSMCLLHAIVRGKSQAIWREQLWLAALLLLLLPVLNAMTGGLPLPRAITSGQWGVAGVELTAMAFSAVLAWTGWKIGVVSRSPSRIARGTTKLAA